MIHAQAKSRAEQSRTLGSRYANVDISADSAQLCLSSLRLGDDLGILKHVLLRQKPDQLLCYALLVALSALEVSLLGWSW